MVELATLCGSGLRDSVLPDAAWCAGTTIELVGLKELGAANVMGEVSRDELLKDIQFRGAISDFHAYKAKIQAAGAQ